MLLLLSSASLCKSKHTLHKTVPPTLMPKELGHAADTRVHMRRLRQPSLRKTSIRLAAMVHMTIVLDGQSAVHVQQM